MTTTRRMTDTDRAALAAWRAALPARAMTLLADAGLGEADRERWLRIVAKVRREVAEEYARPAYVK